MLVFKKAPEILQGERDFAMAHRNFELILLNDKQARDVDAEADSVDAILKKGKVDPDSLDPMAVDADSRVKYADPSTRQLLFLLHNRNTQSERVWGHRGPGLLYQVGDEGEPNLNLNIPEPVTYAERTGSVSVEEEGPVEGREDEEEDTETGKRRKGAKKSDQQTEREQREERNRRLAAEGGESGSGEKRPIALLTRDEMILMASGEGLIINFPLAALQPA